MSSAVRSLPKIYRMNFEISWNFYKKGINNALTTGLDADKFATFWMFLKGFITHLFCK